MDSFQDGVSGEIDRRKIERLVDSGAVSREELNNATVYFVCECGKRQDIDNEVCESCGAET